ncbi:MAG: UDP-N-acetylmuramate dehydrogenase [Candidatus Omnitrophota bacterium]
MLRCEYGKLLSSHTTLRIGGPVFCWIEPENISDLFESIAMAEDRKKAFAIMGRGSNVLAAAQGFDGVAVYLNKGFDFIEKEGEDVVKVGSGLPLSLLVERTTEWGLTGCEFLAGIPGSFGGALFMNAGTRDVDNPEIMREAKDIVLDAAVLDIKTKEKATLKKNEIAFKYRASGLDGKCVISGRLKLDKADKSAIENRVKCFMKKREWIKMLGFPSAGSVFKNPANAKPAGRLIEECGLKGAKVGGAEISNAHANFIVNTGNATSNDVIKLIEQVRSRVNEKFGINLELELKVL